MTDKKLKFKTDKEFLEQELFESYLKSGMDDVMSFEQYKLFKGYGE